MERRIPVSSRATSSAFVLRISAAAVQPPFPGYTLRSILSAEMYVVVVVGSAVLVLEADSSVLVGNAAPRFQMQIYKIDASRKVCPVGIHIAMPVLELHAVKFTGKIVPQPFPVFQGEKG